MPAQERFNNKVITGLEILCDHCLALGRQLAREFLVTVDFEGDPQINVRCPNCQLVIEIVFVGKGLRWHHDHEEQ